MAYTAKDLRSHLEDAWDHAPVAANSLRVELRANVTALGALLSQGQIASVSKNSASQSYAFSGNGVLTTKDLREIWQDLVDLFDVCETILTAAGQITAGDDNDAAIYAEMRARIAPGVGDVYQTRPDISNLRLCA